MVLALELVIFLLDTSSVSMLSIQTVEDQFIGRFPGTPVPSWHSVRALIEEFRETGSVKGHEHRNRSSVLDQEKLQIISFAMRNSPSKCIWILVTAHKAVRKKLNLIACETIQKFLTGNSDDILNYAVYTKQVWFKLSGYVHSQTYVYGLPTIHILYMNFLENLEK